MNKNSICQHCGHDEKLCSTEETYRRAKEWVLYKGFASPGLLQRDLKISYQKAAEIMKRLGIEKIIEPEDGAKPRKVINY